MTEGRMTIDAVAMFAHQSENQDHPSNGARRKVPRGFDSPGTEGGPKRQKQLPRMGRIGVMTRPPGFGLAGRDCVAKSTVLAAAVCNRICESNLVFGMPLSA